MKNTFSRFYPFVFVGIFFSFLLIQLNFMPFHLSALPENFFWRGILIKHFNNFRYRIGDRVLLNSVAGKDGWMFFSGNESLDDYQKISRVKRREVSEFTAKLNKINKIVQENGGNLLLVIAPDKHTVYPQYMPDEIPVLGKSSRLDKVLSYMEIENSSVEVVDLRFVLMQSSSNYLVYSKTDTHWSCMGAYYAYQEVMKRISVYHPDVSPRPLEDFEIELSAPVVQDIPRMERINYLEEKIQLTPKFKPYQLTVKEEKGTRYVKFRIIENQKQDLPSLLVFHDSFYISCFNTLFEQHFSHILSVHRSMAKDYTDYVNQEKADVVIFEVSERYLPEFMAELADKSK